jgi:hypothetical protein
MTRTLLVASLKAVGDSGLIFVGGSHFAEAQSGTNVSDLINSDPECSKQTVGISLRKNLSS